METWKHSYKIAILHMSGLEEKLQYLETLYQLYIVSILIRLIPIEIKVSLVGDSDFSID